MSEADPRETEKEYFEEVSASEPERLGKLVDAAHAACDVPIDDPDEIDTEEDSSDVELEEPDPTDHSGQYEV